MYHKTNKTTNNNQQAFLATQPDLSERTVAAATAADVGLLRPLLGSLLPPLLRQRLAASGNEPGRLDPVSQMWLELELQQRLQQQQQAAPAPPPVVCCCCLWIEARVLLFALLRLMMTVFGKFVCAAGVVWEICENVPRIYY